MQTITGKDNRWLKILRAVATKKGRKQYGCYLAEGLRLCGEVLDQSLPVLQTLFSESALEDSRFAALCARAEQAGLPVAAVRNGLLESACATDHPQGVAMLLPLPEPLPLPWVEGGCYAYADGIRDPGNLGTIIRTARAAGVQGLLLSPDSADPLNPKTVRSAMGASLRLPIRCCAAPEEARQILADLGCSILVAAAEGRDILSCGPLLQQTHCWVLGSEAEGASAFWREQAQALVRLPMEPGSESLNVASAAAVLFYQSRFARASLSPDL